MSSRLREGLLIITAATLIGACGSAEERGVDQPVDWRQPAVDLELAPISTFAEHCASCHGAGGSMYNRPFTHQGEALREKVVEMMIGPAALDPSEPEIEAMLQYHLTMREATPFAAATNAGAFASGAQTTLRGEATEGAMVFVEVENARRDARRGGGGAAWSVDGPEALPVVIEAQASGSVYRLEVGE